MTDYIKIFYVSGPPTIPLLVQTIRQNLKEKVKRFPNNDALVCIEQNYRNSYSEFYNQTTTFVKSPEIYN
ncbi:hypothetical protein [Flavobacterium beibuense]|uniref:hypothetical protein n=1 Tax=Flavobacterium beibuense TaxID=657326 RepID=UPI003A942F09